MDTPIPLNIQYQSINDDHPFNIIKPFSTVFKNILKSANRDSVSINPDEIRILVYNISILIHIIAKSNADILIISNILDPLSIKSLIDTYLDTNDINNSIFSYNILSQSELSSAESQPSNLFINSNISSHTTNYTWSKYYSTHLINDIIIIYRNNITITSLVSCFVGLTSIDFTIDLKTPLYPTEMTIYIANENIYTNHHDLSSPSSSALTQSSSQIDDDADDNATPFRFETEINTHIYCRWGGYSGHYILLGNTCPPLSTLDDLNPQLLELYTQSKTMQKQVDKQQQQQQQQRQLNQHNNERNQNNNMCDSNALLVSDSASPSSSSSSASSSSSSLSSSSLYRFNDNVYPTTYMAQHSKSYNQNMTSPRLYSDLCPFTGFIPLISGASQSAFLSNNHSDSLYCSWIPYSFRNITSLSLLSSSSSSSSSSLIPSSTSLLPSPSPSALPHPILPTHVTMITDCITTLMSNYDSTINNHSFHSLVVSPSSLIVESKISSQQSTSQYTQRQDQHQLHSSSLPLSSTASISSLSSTLMIPHNTSESHMITPSTITQYSQGSKLDTTTCIVTPSISPIILSHQVEYKSILPDHIISSLYDTFMQPTINNRNTNPNSNIKRSSSHVSNRVTNAILFIQLHLLQSSTESLSSSSSSVPLSYPPTLLLSDIQHPPIPTRFMLLAPRTITSSIPSIPQSIQPVHALGYQASSSHPLRPTPSYSQAFLDTSGESASVLAQAGTQNQPSQQSSQDTVDQNSTQGIEPSVFLSSSRLAIPINHSITSSGMQSPSSATIPIRSATTMQGSYTQSSQTAVIQGPSTDVTRDANLCSLSSASPLQTKNVNVLPPPRLTSNVPLSPPRGPSSLPFDSTIPAMAANQRHLNDSQLYGDPIHHHQNHPLSSQQRNNNDSSSHHQYDIISRSHTAPPLTQGGGNNTHTSHHSHSSLPLDQNSVYHDRHRHHRSSHYSISSPFRVLDNSNDIYHHNTADYIYNNDTNHPNGQSSISPQCTNSAETDDVIIPPQRVIKTHKKTAPQHNTPATLQTPAIDHHSSTHHHDNTEIGPIPFEASTQSSQPIIIVTPSSDNAHQCIDNISDPSIQQNSNISSDNIIIVSSQNDCIHNHDIDTAINNTQNDADGDSNDTSIINSQNDDSSRDTTMNDDDYSLTNTTKQVSLLCRTNTITDKPKHSNKYNNNNNNDDILYCNKDIIQTTPVLGIPDHHQTTMATAGDKFQSCFDISLPFSSLESHTASTTLLTDLTTTYTPQPSTSHDYKPYYKKCGSCQACKDGSACIKPLSMNVRFGTATFMTRSLSPTTSLTVSNCSEGVNDEDNDNIISNHILSQHISSTSSSSQEDNDSITNSNTVVLSSQISQDSDDDDDDADDDDDDCPDHSRSIPSLEDRRRLLGGSRKRVNHSSQHSVDVENISPSTSQCRRISQEIQDENGPILSFPDEIYLDSDSQMTPAVDTPLSTPGDADDDTDDSALFSPPRPDTATKRHNNDDNDDDNQIISNLEQQELPQDQPPMPGYRNLSSLQSSLENNIDDDHHESNTDLNIHHVKPITNTKRNNSLTILPPRKISISQIPDSQLFDMDDDSDPASPPAPGHVKSINKKDNPISSHTSDDTLQHDIIDLSTTTQAQIDNNTTPKKNRTTTTIKMSDSPLSSLENHLLTALSPGSSENSPSRLVTESTEPLILRPSAFRHSTRPSDNFPFSSAITAHQPVLDTIESLSSLATLQNDNDDEDDKNSSNNNDDDDNNTMTNKHTKDVSNTSTSTKSNDTIHNNSNDAIHNNNNDTIPPVIDTAKLFQNILRSSSSFACMLGKTASSSSPLTNNEILHTSGANILSSLPSSLNIPDTDMFPPIDNMYRLGEATYADYDDYNLDRLNSLPLESVVAEVSTRQYQPSSSLSSMSSTNQSIQLSRDSSISPRSTNNDDSNKKDKTSQHPGSAPQNRHAPTKATANSSNTPSIRNTNDDTTVDRNIPVIDILDTQLSSDSYLQTSSNKDNKDTTSANTTDTDHNTSPSRRDSTPMNQPNPSQASVDVIILTDSSQSVDLPPVSSSSDRMPHSECEDDDNEANTAAAAAAAAAVDDDNGDGDDDDTESRDDPYGDDSCPPPLERVPYLMSDYAILPSSSSSSLSQYSSNNSLSRHGINRSDSINIFSDEDIHHTSHSVISNRNSKKRHAVQTNIKMDMNSPSTKRYRPNTHSNSLSFPFTAPPLHLTQTSSLAVIDDDDTHNSDNDSDNDQNNTLPSTSNLISHNKQGSQTTPRQIKQSRSRITTPQTAMPSRPLVTTEPTVDLVPTPLPSSSLRRHPIHHSPASQPRDNTLTTTTTIDDNIDDCDSVDLDDASPTCRQLGFNFSDDDDDDDDNGNINTSSIPTTMTILPIHKQPSSSSFTRPDLPLPPLFLSPRINSVLTRCKQYRMKSLMECTKLVQYEVYYNHPHYINLEYYKPHNHIHLFFEEELKNVKYGHHCNDEYYKRKYVYFMIREAWSLLLLCHAKNLVDASTATAGALSYSKIFSTEIVHIPKPEPQTIVYEVNNKMRNIPFKATTPNTHDPHHHNTTNNYICTLKDYTQRYFQPSRLIQKPSLYWTTSLQYCDKSYSSNSTLSEHKKYHTQWSIHARCGAILKHNQLKAKHKCIFNDIPSTTTTTTTPANNNNKALVPTLTLPSKNNSDITTTATTTTIKHILDDSSTGPRCRFYGCQYYTKSFVDMIQHIALWHPDKTTKELNPNQEYLLVYAKQHNITHLPPDLVQLSETLTKNNPTWYNQYNNKGYILRIALTSIIITQIQDITRLGKKIDIFSYLYKLYLTNYTKSNQSEDTMFPF